MQLVGCELTGSLPGSGLAAATCVPAESAAAQTTTIVTTAARVSVLNGIAQRILRVGSAGMPQPKSSRSRAKGKQKATETPEEVRANLAHLRERLVSSITLTSDRLQEVTDDLVRRGRMTRQDAEDLLVRLTSAGRSQTDQLIAEVEELLGRSRVTRPAGRVVREVDRARRAMTAGGGSGGVPIDGYDELTAAEIIGRLGDLTPAQLRKVGDYERRNANRKSVLAAVDKALK